MFEHDFKLYEVLDGRLREVVDIDKMQYGFMQGRGALDAVFLLTTLSGKFRAKNRKLFLIFVDLENAFDRVPMEVIRFALRRKGVPEYFIKVVKLLPQLMGELSSSFSVKLGVNQGSALSPLLFIMVLAGPILELCWVRLLHRI